MKSDEISSFLNSRIEAGDFPSAVYLVAEKGKVVLSDAVGNAVVEPELIPARPDTIYDLASVTKVLVTSLMAAILLDSGEISLDDQVSDLLPDFGAEDKREITVEQLLSHSSGLPAWKPLYLTAASADEIVTDINLTPLVPGQPSPTYSDLNFILLGAVIERITGKTLDVAAKWKILVPLGTADTFFNPPPELRPRIAASENGNAFEKQTCVEKGFIAADDERANSAFRTDTIWGEVHDGNAYFMGGVAGHAGLFSTADDVLKIAMQFLGDHSQLLTPETCNLFSANFTPDAAEHRSFGFQLASTAESTAGTKMSPKSFGHLGFTGTSVWIDPDADRVFILLTNRTHNHPLPFVLINSVRRQFHDLAIDLLDQNS